MTLSNPPFSLSLEIDLPYDKEKNERRPFCFISFQNEQSAQEVLRLQKHTIGDVTVDVKRAKPKTSNNQQQQAMYDPYGQQSVYSSYGSGGGVPSYGSSAYSAADPYANWNNYSYNQQANPTGFSYNGSGTSSVPNSGTSSYSQYPQHQLNSQYSYAPANANSANEYYSQYGYSGQQQATPSVYADPNGRLLLRLIVLATHSHSSLRRRLRVQQLLWFHGRRYEWVSR